METERGKETEQEIAERLKDKIRRAIQRPANEILYYSKGLPVITLDKPSTSLDKHQLLRNALLLERAAENKHLIVSHQPARTETYTSGFFRRRHETIQYPESYSISLNTPYSHKTKQMRLTMQAGQPPQIYEVTVMEFGETYVPQIGSGFAREATTEDLMVFDGILEDPGYTTY